MKGSTQNGSENNNVKKATTTTTKANVNVAKDVVIGYELSKNVCSKNKNGTTKTKQMETK